MARLSRQLRLLIVQDCLASLDELLAVADDPTTTVATSSTLDPMLLAAPWAQLQQLSCANNFIPRMDASLVRNDDDDDDDDATLTHTHRHN